MALSPISLERAGFLARIVAEKCEKQKNPVDATRLMAALFSGAFGQLYVAYYPDGGPFCGLYFRSYVIDDYVHDCTIQDMALATGASLEGARSAFLNGEGVKCEPLDVTPFGEYVEWWIKNSSDDDIAEVIGELRERLVL